MQRGWGCQPEYFGDVVQELQKCIAPLMCLDGDEIVEALLLEPTVDKPRTSPTLEEEAALLREELELAEVPEATAFLQECLETPEPKEPTEQIDISKYPCSFIPYFKTPL